MNQWCSYFIENIRIIYVETINSHLHPDLKYISATQLTCSIFQIEKNPRAPNTCVKHHVLSIMSTDVVDPKHPTGAKLERYLMKFTYLGCRFTFFIPLQTGALVSQDFMESLMYGRNTNGKITTLNKLYNLKDFFKDTVEAARFIGTFREPLMHGIKELFSLAASSFLHQHQNDETSFLWFRSV